MEKPKGEGEREREGGICRRSEGGRGRLVKRRMGEGERESVDDPRAQCNHLDKLNTLGS